MTINREHLATQKILDLILDECRYWQGRDEARRGSFAILYAAAKEIAAQAQAAPEAEPTAWARQTDLDESDPAMFVAREEVQESGYVVPLYTAPQHDAELVELLTQAEARIEELADALENSTEDDPEDGTSEMLTEARDLIAKLATLSAKP